ARLRGVTAQRQVKEKPLILQHDAGIAVIAGREQMRQWRTGALSVDLGRRALVDHRRLRTCHVLRLRIDGGTRLRV
ncbi:hypothetical protein R0J93_29395, partial [Pseudoalteromonas sp. SIMBA_148]